MGRNEENLSESSKSGEYILMIFVTVGTHEQQFNRLIEYIDNLAEKTDEEIIIQTGFSTYKPKYCIWKEFFSYSEMKEYIQKARIVITHGGPSSFMAPLQIGKIPIVVPRRKEFDEHVNDHQLNFCRKVAKRQGNIIEVENIKELYEKITDYDEIVANMQTGLESNNSKFCGEFEKIVQRLF